MSGGLFATALAICQLKPSLLPHGIDAELADAIWRLAVRNWRPEDIVRELGPRVIRGKWGQRRLSEADCTVVIEVVHRARRTLAGLALSVQALDVDRVEFLQKYEELARLLEADQAPSPPAARERKQAGR